MKKSIFTLLIMLVTIGLFAGGGDFEGEITYSIKLSGENADMMKAFMPTGYKYKIKDDKMLFRMEGGMMASMLGDILIKEKEKKTYIINHEAKTVFYINPDEFDKEENEVEAPKITDLKETETIMGYKCKKYKIEKKSEEGTEVQYMWATEELKSAATKSKSKLTGNMFVEGIDGFPLKITMEINQGMISLDMSIVVTNIDEKKMSSDIFDVPSNYSMEEFDPNTFGKDTGF